MLSPGKDQRGGDFLLLQDPQQQVVLFAFFHIIDTLFDLLNRRGYRRRFHADRILQQRSGQAGDLLRHRRREQQRLLFVHQQCADAFYIVDKTHVQHPVGFIEHKDFHLAQIQQTLTHQIEQTARCRDQNIRTFFQLINLRPLLDAAENHDGLQRQALAVQLEVIHNLDRQLAGRRQHQCLDRPLAFLRLFHQLVENRQRERRGFACAGLRQPQQIAALQDRRDRFLLNLGRVRISHPLTIFQDRRMDR